MPATVEVGFAMSSAERDQDGFLRFWETELRPALASQGLARGA